MKDIKKLIDLRRLIKRKKPIFSAQDSHKRKEVKKKWRRPKGLHSKMRLNRKGYPITVSKGWKSPKKIRSFHGLGYKIKIVHNISEINGIDNRNDAIIISSRVGFRKRIMIIEESKKHNIKILNFKDVDKYIKDTKEKMKKSKEETIERRKSQKEKEEEIKTKEKKKDTLAEKIQSEEEKKDSKKKEVDKVLTKKDGL